MYVCMISQVLSTHTGKISLQVLLVCLPHWARFFWIQVKHFAKDHWQDRLQPSPVPQLRAPATVPQICMLQRQEQLLSPETTSGLRHHRLQFQRPFDGGPKVGWCRVHHSACSTAPVQPEFFLKPEATNLYNSTIYTAQICTVNLMILACVATCSSNQSSLYHFIPHIFVWGYCFWFCTRPASVPPPPPPLWHNFVTRHLSHTTLSHTIFHTQLCHTPSFTHHFVTHHLSHTTLSHNIFHTQLFHTHNLSHNYFVTHNFATYNFVTYNFLSYTIFHTPLCHTLPFTHTQLCHTLFFTHKFVTHSFHTPSFTHHLCHTFSFTQLLKTSTCVWRGRRGNCWSCCTWLALVARLVTVGRRWSPGAPRHFAWQAWHFLTSTFVSRGRRGTWRHLPAFGVAGVALVDLVALGWLWWRAWSPLVAVGRRATCGDWWHPRCKWIHLSQIHSNTTLSNTTLSRTIFTHISPTCNFIAHNFVTHKSFAHQLFHTHLPHTQLSYPQLCHTQSFHTRLSHISHMQLRPHIFVTHNFVTHNFVTHSSFTHNFVTNTQLCHTHNFVTRNSFTHTILSQTNLSHTTLSHTQSVTQLLCHTQLCHIQCTTLSHTTFCHIQYFTHITLSHTTLSHTTLSHTTLSQAIFHTQLCHTTLHIQLLKLLILHHLHFPFCLFLPAASTTVSDYWEKLTCGVIWSFHCTNIPSQAKNLQELSGHKVCSAVLRVIWPFALGWHVPHTLFMQNIGSNGQLLISSGLLVQK